MVGVLQWADVSYLSLPAETNINIYLVFPKKNNLRFKYHDVFIVVLSTTDFKKCPGLCDKAAVLGAAKIESLHNLYHQKKKIFV
jgi:hypothetical protein